MNNSNHKIYQAVKFKRNLLKKTNKYILGQIILLIVIYTIPIFFHLLIGNHRRHFEKGVKLGNSDNWSLAAQAFEQAITIYPKNSLYQAHLAISYARLFEENDPWDIIIRDSSITSKKKQTLLNLAIDHMKTASGLNPWDSRYKFYLGWLYLYNKEFRKAKDMFQISLRNDGNNFSKLASLSIAQLEFGSREESIKTITLAVREFPLIIESRFWMYISSKIESVTFLLILQRNIKYYEDRNIEDPIAKAKLGHLYFYLKRFDKAKEYYLQALYLRPSLQGARFQLGRLYYFDGELKKAIKEFYTSGFVGFINAFSVLAEIYSESGDRELSTKMYRMYERLNRSNEHDLYRYNTLKLLYKSPPLSHRAIPRHIYEDIFPVPRLLLN